MSSPWSLCHALSELQRAHSEDLSLGSENSVQDSVSSTSPRTFFDDLRVSYTSKQLHKNSDPHKSKEQSDLDRKTAKRFDEFQFISVCLNSVN